MYTGDHIPQMITDSWLGGSGLFLNYLAEQGYVVFTLDNRGTSYRGKDFEQALFRNLGTVEVEDQMCGVSYLKSHQVAQPPWDQRMVIRRLYDYFNAAEKPWYI